MSINVDSIPSPQEQAQAAAAAKAAPAEPKVESPAAGDESHGAESAEASGASEEEEQEDQEDNSGDEQEEGDEQAEAEALKPKKPLKGFRKRIDRLNKAKSAAEQERDYWKSQAMAGKAPPEQKADARQEADDGKPNADDFETHDEYVESLSAWKAGQIIKENETKQREARLKQEHTTQLETFQKGIKELREANEDFDDVMEGVDDVRMSLAVQTLLLESENGPTLGYELAKNPEEFARINQLSPLAAARELGKFESKLASSKAAAPKRETKITKAPAPISPVGSKGTGASTKNPDDMSFEEFERWRSKQ